MEEKKFNLMESSVEEQTAFLKHLETYLNDNSLDLDIIPVFRRVSPNSDFSVVSQMVLRKKVEVEEPKTEVIKPTENK